MSVFDERNLAEISAPELYPGERLVVCRNPLLAAERALKREALLEATEAKLDLVLVTLALPALSAWPGGCVATEREPVSGSTRNRPV